MYKHLTRVCKSSFTAGLNLSTYVTLYLYWSLFSFSRWRMWRNLCGKSERFEHIYESYVNIGGSSYTYKAGHTMFTFTLVNVIWLNSLKKCNFYLTHTLPFNYASAFWYPLIDSLIPSYYRIESTREQHFLVWNGWK